MLTAQTPQRVAIILNGPNDWDEWLEVIKTKAVGGRIWEFVDPRTNKDELPTLRRPTIPSAKDVNPEKSTLSQLTDDEKDELKLQRYDYKHQLALYERQDAALASLRSFIQEMISRTFLPYTFKCDTTYDMLVALRKRVAHTDNAQKGRASQGTFPASYQGQSLQPENSDDKKSDDKKSDDKKTDDKKSKGLCLCGADHRFKACPYLIELIRSKNWKPDPAIQKQI